MEVGEAAGKKALAGLLNNFHALCGPSQVIELPDRRLSADDISKMAVRFGPGGPHLIYIEEGKARLYLSDR